MFINDYERREITAFGKTKLLDPPPLRLPLCVMLRATLQCGCNIHWPPSKRDDFGSRRPSSNEMFQFTSQHLTAVNVQSFQQQELLLGALISLHIRHESMLG